MLKKLLRPIIHAASAVALCCGLANTAEAISFGQISQLYFFGDSLTDSGYNDLWAFPTPLPVGKAPTFTTFGGYTWAQYLARDIKAFTLPIYPGPAPADKITNNSIYPVPGFVSGTLTGINYAAGGSTTNSTGFNETWAPSLHQQVSKYLATAGGVADPNAVYFLWSGANDILTLIAGGGPTPTQLQLLQAASTAATNIGNEAARLSAAGAKRIVVMSLPNIGLTPLIGLLSGSSPTLPATMKNLTFTFNSMLNTQLGKVISQYNTKILYISVYDLLDNVILATQAGQSYVVAGQSFKFVNYTSPACAAASSAIYCPSSAPTNYVFADVLHPSDMAHRVLSLYVETQMSNWS
jgi:outer membrane lipase/esterase